MWEQKLLELFTTLIPQGFAFILLFFSLVGIKIEKKSFTLFSILFAVLTFFIRPYVNFGVHSVIMLIVLVLIAVSWGKSNVISSIVSGIISFVVAYVCEWLTFLVLEMSKFNMELLNTNVQIRVGIGFIPIISFLIVGLVVYYSKLRIKMKGTNNNAV